MNAKDYAVAIKRFRIEQFGFDTQARVLNITKDEAKAFWNATTDKKFKRVPRTEYNMRYLPEISSKFKPYWRVELPEKYLMFYVTPTAPILVPNGFITDKGSIPLPFQNIISIFDREMMTAFLVHDVECEMKRMTRFSIDGLIYEVGTEMRANWLKKNIIYSAVRLGGILPGKDSIRNDFNVSKYNRELIVQCETNYNLSYTQMKHLDFVETLHGNINK